MSDDRNALKELLRHSNPKASHSFLHYLYFPDQKQAQIAADKLRRHGYDVEDRKGADGVNWLVLAKRRMLPTEDAVRDVRNQMEALAAVGGGMYDGWEAETEQC